MTPILALLESSRSAVLEGELSQQVGAIGAIYAILLLAGLIVLTTLSARWRRRPPAYRVAIAELLARPWRGVDLFQLLVVLSLGMVSVMLLRKPWLRWTDTWPLSEASSLVLLQSVLFHLLGVLAVGIVLARRQWTWREAFGIEWGRLPRDGVRGLLALLAALPALLGITLIYHVVLALLGHEATLQDVAFAIADEPQRWMRVYLVILAVGIAPLFEEILFRGLLLPVLSRRFGVWAGSLATSFLFAAVHGHLPSFATLFAFSLALGAAYLFTESLAVAVVMHALFNAITVSILIGFS